jgi:hypothetical protein
MIDFKTFPGAIDYERILINRVVPPDRNTLYFSQCRRLVTQ